MTVRNNITSSFTPVLVRIQYRGFRPDKLCPCPGTQTVAAKAGQGFMDYQEAKTFCQELIDLYQKQKGFLPVALRLKTVQRGTANYNKRTLTIPYWMFEDNYSLAYCYYYVLHEISHFIHHDKYYSRNHPETFKNIERELLADFGLTPVYSRAYAKQLLSENGEILYSRRKR